MKYNQYNKILIAISGGQDSIFLINIINYLINKYSIIIQTEYIYIDHQWKYDSKIQLMHLINYILLTNQKLFIYQINSHILKENIAREFRYNIIIQHAKHKNSHIIMTAHSQTDKIETFFINLIRGTSIDGATSLRINRHMKQYIRLIRPILNLSRSYIKFNCMNFCLPVWSDSSNYSMNIYRNRIRNELIPYIANYFNHSINKQINKFLNYCLIDNEYIKQNTLKLYMHSCHYKYIALNYNQIKSQHSALQNRIFQLFFMHHCSILLDHTIIIKIQKILKHNKPGKIIQFDRITIALKSSWIYIT
uniref:tRNA(Ile)-lysidine synthase n=1 Tax=Anotrichium furcellatum TaxID=41999 RepID=A0A4D6WJC5_9FLOR|nr:tRNA Ile-lysidine synthetase [Anotrichium furcellatum]